MAVLASIPLQQGVAGGELIQNVTYGVVLLSIVMTSLLVLSLDKTKMADVYAWVFSPHLPKRGPAATSRPEEETGVTGDIVPVGTRLFGRGKKEE